MLGIILGISLVTPLSFADNSHKNEIPATKLTLERQKGSIVQMSNDQRTNNPITNSSMIETPITSSQHTEIQKTAVKEMAGQESVSQVINDKKNKPTPQKIDPFIGASQAYQQSLATAKKQYAKQWSTAYLSSKFQWVTYSTDNKIRRRLDFHTGQYVIEIIGTPSLNQLEKIVEAQSRALLTTDIRSALKQDPILSPIIEALPQSPQKILENIRFEQLISKQTQQRQIQPNGSLVTQVSIQLDKESLNQRKRAYISLILERAKRWNIEPALIMAIIHTESHFNPMAQSYHPAHGAAYGLMQITLKMIAKDVALFYMSEGQRFNLSELFIPEANVTVGAAYLHILTQGYLKAVTNPHTRRYLTISSYKAGISAIATHFTGTRSLKQLAQIVNKMSPEQVFASLTTQFPSAETREHLKQVETQRLYYESYLSL